MPIRLHRCSKTWLHLGIEPCWKVQRELDRRGIPYEIVKHPNARWHREAIEQLSGQKLLPVIEFEDGTIYRAESKDMAERIRSGNLRGQDIQAPGSEPEPTSAPRTESAESAETTEST
jgi:glutaredoxin